MSHRFRRIALVLAPGILVAATGVGSGDLITAAFAGSKIGAGVAWAALAGAVLKWFLNEGLARWQMGTHTTLLEGWHAHLGRPIRWLFLLYLIIWAFITGGAMVNACGVAGYALWPIFEDPAHSKILWGVVHSFAGLILVLIGGFKLFERMMAGCIAVMFITALLTAVLIIQDADGHVLREAFTPTFPSAPQARKWLLGILGGVGGTVTLLAYGYWIRERNRNGLKGVRACRIDLAAGYLMTGLFGAAMVVIGSRLSLTGAGDRVALQLADQLEKTLSPAHAMADASGWTVGRLAHRLFLLGFWGAVFSSLLGVWQSTPYLFADLASMGRRMKTKSNATTSEPQPMPDYARTPIYRTVLIAMSILPLILLWQPAATVQLAYTVLGAFFMPFLAVTLLYLNNSRYLDTPFRSGWVTNAFLSLTLAFFAYQGMLELIEKLSPGRT